MSADSTDRLGEKDIPKPTKDDLLGWLHEHGDVLFRYAMKRVGKVDVAEDLVQETFVSALRAADRFEGRSKVQTWLIGILRNKITDHMRRLGRGRETPVDDQGYDRLFQHGNWKVGVQRWPTDPSQALESDEFWEVLKQCQGKLPEKLAAAFRMRDLEELAMAEICDILSISASNLSVRLHRARVLLRDCLEQHWFSPRRKP